MSGVQQDRTRSTGGLCVCATPIGNLSDMSPRAQEALRERESFLTQVAGRKVRPLTGRMTPQEKKEYLHSQAFENTVYQIRRRDKVYQGLLRGELLLDVDDGALPVAVLQPFLDVWLLGHSGSIDYIHGDEVAASLARKPDSLAFLLPAIAKEDFFRGIVMDGVLPRKTFSMGHAQEKRYYLECRKIR